MPLDPELREEIEAKQEERKTLNKLRLNSFTATPSTIDPFDESTLSWSVFVPPEAAHVPFSLAGTTVDRTGSKVVSPLKTAAFLLEACGTRTNRVLGSVVVTVNTGDCQQLEFSPSQLKPNVEKLRDRFLGGNITSRGEISVTTGDWGIGVDVPLGLAIEDFYNADAVVILKLMPSVRDGEAVFKLVSVDVDIIFHLAEHIFSAGAATAAQAVLQPLANDLIMNFLGAQLEGDTAREVNEIIRQVLEYFKANDPENRDYRLYALSTSNTGLMMTACPI